MLALALVAAAVAFLVSASAGLGGSLILVPAFSLLFGVKQGIALAALLLAGNNVAKVIAYRHTIPIKPALGVVALTVLGSVVGALLFLRAPEGVVQAAVAVAIVAAFIAERVKVPTMPQVSAGILALGSGLASGFSGTSGPLKGLALRQLKLDRQHLAGAASLVSLAGDLAKTAVFGGAALLDRRAWTVFAASVLIMPLATLAGRGINRQLGEVAYAWLFWGVMTGYALRLVVR